MKKTLLLWLAFGLVAAAGQAADFYISPDGDDAQTGTITKPFRTLDRARGAVRELKTRNGGRPPAGGITVWLRGGRYELPRTFVLGPEDSGEAGRPVAYRAYGNEIPVLSGGRLVRGWHRVTETVPGLPAAATGRVWAASLPADANGLWPFRQLWANGNRLTRARWPNNTDVQFRIADAVAKAAQTDEAWRQTVLAGWKTIDLLNAADTQGFPGGVLPADLGNTNAELFVRSTGGWATMRIPILQAAGARLTMAAPLGYLWYYWGGTHMMCAVQSAGFIENALSLLDQPGEWYLDRAARRVYYLPAGGEDPATMEFIAPRLEQLISLRGANVAPVAFVEFRGLRLQHAEWPLPAFGYRPMLGCYFGDKVTQLAVEPPVPVGSLRANDRDPDYVLPAAVDLVHARNCLLELCRVSHAGATGIGLGEGCRNNQVVGCEVSDVGGTGIHAGLAHGAICAKDFAWSRPEDEPRNNEIANCYVHHNGHLDWGAFGIMSSYCRGNRIAHNLVEQQPYSGICACFTMAAFPSGRREEIAVEYNHVRDVLLKLHDGGGIYTKDGVTNTAVIRGNLIHDIGGNTSQNNGIFLDDMSYGFRIESNIIYGVNQPVRCNINNTRHEDFTWGVNYFGTSDYPAELASKAGPEEPYRSILLKPER